MQPGVAVEKLAEMRKSNPGKGPHSIIGPVAVNGAEPGDVLEIRYKRIQPMNWAAVFNNPGALGTGLLAADFPQGQVKYIDLDLKKMSAPFAPNIQVPLKPFQGTLGLAPPDGFYPPLRPGVTSSVPPGPHGGNIDLSELSEGSTLYLPVWKPGGLIFTGDSHAVQGDGEICLTALETRMQELRIQVVLHKQKNMAWPIVETPSHWIPLATDKDLNVAMTLAARNAIKFPGQPGQPDRAGRLRVVQHRRQLPGDAGGGHHARCARNDPQELVHGRAAAKNCRGLKSASSLKVISRGTAL
jgi:acetamidase/formamidase